jgi:plastocyanin
LLTAIVVGALAYASVASAAATQIRVDDNFYAPDLATRNLSSGASFTWVTATGATALHNVRQNATLFNSGAPTRNLNFSARVSAGTYHYYCTLHGTASGGPGDMDGVVRVRPIFAAAPTGLPFTVRWALAGATGTTVQVVAGRTYHFQARSQKSTAPNQPSGWSPTLTVTT